MVRAMRHGTPSLWDLIAREMPFLAACHVATVTEDRRRIFIGKITRKV
jgi:hypothetical protein